jgi:hypothetical protein
MKQIIRKTFNRLGPEKFLAMFCAATVCYYAVGLTLLTMLPVGCSTMQPDQLARVKTLCKVAAYVGTSEYLRGHPDAKPKFAEAVTALKILEASETVDLATLLAIVNKLPVKDLGDERGRMVVTAATLILSDYAGSLDAADLKNLLPVVTAIRQGVELGLQ